MDWYAVGSILSDVVIVGGVAGFLAGLSILAHKMARTPWAEHPDNKINRTTDVERWLKIRDNAVGPQERDVACSMLQYLGYTEPALSVLPTPKAPVAPDVLQRLKDELAMARARRTESRTQKGRQAWADYEASLRAQLLNLSDRASEIQAAQANPDLYHKILENVYAVKEDRTISPQDEMLAICADVRRPDDPTGRRYECLHAGGTRLSDGTWINFTHYRAPLGPSFRLTDPSRNITVKGGLL